VTVVSPCFFNFLCQHLHSSCSCTHDVIVGSHAAAGIRALPSPLSSLRFVVVVVCCCCLLLLLVRPPICPFSHPSVLLFVRPSSLMTPRSFPSLTCRPWLFVINSFPLFGAATPIPPKENQRVEEELNGSTKYLIWPGYLHVPVLHYNSPLGCVPVPSALCTSLLPSLPCCVPAPSALYQPTAKPTWLRSRGLCPVPAYCQAYLAAFLRPLPCTSLLPSLPGCVPAASALYQPTFRWTSLLNRPF
jgi:hypothetical protein